MEKLKSSDVQLMSAILFMLLQRHIPRKREDRRNTLTRTRVSIARPEIKDRLRNNLTWIYNRSTLHHVRSPPAKILEFADAQADRGGAIPVDDTSFKAAPRGVKKTRKKMPSVSFPHMAVEFAQG